MALILVNLIEWSYDIFKTEASMELMKIIEVFILIFFALSVAGFSISFFLYKMKKQGANEIPQSGFADDFNMLKPEHVIPARLEMQNQKLAQKYKVEQERFNQIRTNGRRPVVYSHLPNKYKVLNNTHNADIKQQAFFRVNYSNQESIIDHFTIVKPR